MAELSPLRRRMIEDMTVRNMSPATQRSYISAVSKFSRYFGKSPERLELEDVRAFQVHLVSTGVSWPGLNQIVCALRFFYGVTLGEADVPERIPYAREPRKLPVVLSADEVVRFLESVSSLKSRAALTTAYAAGLRASEVASLRVADIDSTRGVILIRHGKGGKDRNVMLSPQLLGILRTYWRLARPTTYLFPGRDDERPIDPTVLHAACRSAVKAAGLTNNPHSAAKTNRSAPSFNPASMRSASARAAKPATRTSQKPLDSRIGACLIPGRDRGRFAMPIPLRTDFDARMARAAARRSKDGPQARRLLALAAIYEGASRSEAAKIGGVTLQLVRDWVMTFNVDGPEGLIDR